MKLIERRQIVGRSLFNRGVYMFPPIHYHIKNMGKIQIKSHSVELENIQNYFCWIVNLWVFHIFWGVVVLIPIIPIIWNWTGYILRKQAAAIYQYIPMMIWPCQTLTTKWNIFQAKLLFYIDNKIWYLKTWFQIKDCRSLLREILREDIIRKNTFSFGHCPKRGGGLPMPEVFGPFSPS